MKALLSVYDKELIDVLANGLIHNGYDVICTEGTHNYRKEKGIGTKSTSEITGFTDKLEGKIKTLHPDIHFMIATGEISLMAVNLIPLGKERGSPLEPMDVGGACLIRSGIKNWKSVCVLTEPAEYHRVLKEIKRDGITKLTRHECAINAIKNILTYDWNVLDCLKNLEI